MTQDLASDRLRQIVTLNEGAKQILRRTVAVDLLALDALVQSAKAGSALVGFEAVSRQMRTWTGDLRREVGTLVEASGAAVLSVSSLVKRAGERRLMEVAANQSAASRSALVSTSDRLLRDLQVLEGLLGQQRRQLAHLVDNLAQLGLMATVLARSAMIEAAYGADEEMRDALAHVASQFAASAADVVRTIAGLRRALAEGHA